MQLERCCSSDLFSIVHPGHMPAEQSTALACELLPKFKVADELDYAVAQLEAARPDSQPSNLAYETLLQAQARSLAEVPPSKTSPGARVGVCAG